MNRTGRNQKLIVVGVILVIIGVICIYWNVNYSPLKVVFHKEMKDRLNKIEESKEICTQKEIEQLPKLLQNHCKEIGLEGSKKYHVVNAEFLNTKFVYDTKKGTLLDMDYDLWLLCDEPFRSAFCKSSMFGIPFEGVDYCTDEKIGGMKGVIGKSIQIFDEHNEQMYQAGLISWLAEGAVINPSILLSKYVTYEEIDSMHVKAKVTYRGVEGEGVFSFDEKGMLTGFESEERQVEEINGVMTPIGWRAVYEDYQEKEGVSTPRVMQAIKVFPDKEVTYFDSQHIQIHYDK